MDIDWHALFGLSVSPLELVIRGTAIYWFLFLLFRVVLHRNLRKELMTKEELLAKLREQGVGDVAEVRAAYIESDGGISVIKRERRPSDQARPRRRAAAK
jgi:uncharacterized membrane protein YcaP (DUF421 family)